MRRLLPAAVALAVLVAAGCGDESGGGARPEMKVSAASSLKNALTDYGREFTPARVRYSFAGSDELAAQIRKGARPAVFAAANTKLPQELYGEKLVEEPVVFASNQLVLAVPSDSEIDSLEDLERDGVTIAIGAKDVPVGSYTREALAKLVPERAERILANVRSEEPDVGGVVGKVAQGGADAGFVYATDVVASDGKLQAIELPAKVEPRVAYAAAVVRGTDHAEQAREFVAGLRDGAGARALQQAGFGARPSDRK